MAAKLFAGQHAPDQFVEIPQETWLNRWDAHRVRRVLEHSVALSSYEAVLSFLEFELEDEKHEDDERSELLEELDPNRYHSATRRKPT